jgi:pimeloyl-ACP methyl ester carboxylesterase
VYGPGHPRMAWVRVWPRTHPSIRPPTVSRRTALIMPAAAVDCSNTPPTVVFSPGAFLSPDIFNDVRTLLEGQGLPSLAVGHPSIGAEPPNKTLADDTAHLRGVLEGLVSEGKDIVVVAHSYGGIVASGAVQGLGAAQRASTSALAGVVMLLYITAFVVPLGMTMLDMMGGSYPPWMKFNVSAASA